MAVQLAGRARWDSFFRPVGRAGWLIVIRSKGLAVRPDRDGELAGPRPDRDQPSGGIGRIAVENGPRLQQLEFEDAAGRRGTRICIQAGRSG